MIKRFSPLLKGTYCALWLLVISLSSAGQPTSPHTVKGIVTDITNGEPIPGAHIYLRNHDYIGDAAKSDGSFSILVPLYAAEDYIVISALGYTTREVSLVSLGSLEQPISFSLNRVPIMLHEIFVTAKRYDLRKICERALQSIPRNYPNRIHFLEGLYRKVETDSLGYTGLVEAQIAIRDTGYKGETVNTQIEVLQARFGDSVIELDSINLKLMDALRTKFGSSHYKSLHHFYESNSLRHYNTPHTVFNKKGFTQVYENLTDENFGWDLENVSIIDGDTILHIHYRFFPPGSKKVQDEIRLSVNLSDYAIIEYSRRMFEWSGTVKFQKLPDNRYYPYYIRSVSPSLVDRGNQYVTIETFEADLTETQTRRKLNRKNMEDRMQSFDVAKFSYDSSFWGQYFNKHPHPLDSAIIKDLEQSRPLTEQFHNKSTP